MQTVVADRVQVPFSARVFDTDVIFEAVREDGDRAVAICKTGRRKQKVSLLDLALPDPPPKGWEWIEAWKYFCWEE